MEKPIEVELSLQAMSDLTPQPSLNQRVEISGHECRYFALVQLHGLWVYGVIGLLSVGLWAFVLRRVHTAQKDSPFQTVRDAVK